MTRPDDEMACHDPGPADDLATFRGLMLAGAVVIALWALGWLLLVGVG